MTHRTRRCEICGKEIDPERIDFIPETRLCTTHGREIQKFGGEFRRSSRHERTSKPGSLKHNYGGVSVTLKRNADAVEKLRAAWESRITD